MSRSLGTGHPRGEHRPPQRWEPQLKLDACAQPTGCQASQPTSRGTHVEPDVSLSPRPAIPSPWQTGRLRRVLRPPHSGVLAAWIGGGQEAHPLRAAHRQSRTRTVNARCPPRDAEGYMHPGLPMSRLLLPQSLLGGGRERKPRQPPLPMAEAPGNEGCTGDLIPGRRQEDSLTKHKWLRISRR